MNSQVVGFDSAHHAGAQTLAQEDVQLSSRDVDRALRVMKRVLALRSLKRRLLRDRNLSGSDTLAIVEALERLERESKTR